MVYNVGIGTTGPSAKLHVEDITVLGTIKTLALFKNNYTENAVGPQTFQIQADNKYDFSPGITLSTNDTKPLALGSNGARTLLINSSGNVGIGTTSPLTPLHIVSPFGKTDTSFRQIASFTTNDAATPFKLTVAVTGAATLANRNLSLQTGDHTIANGGILSLQPIAGDVSLVVGGGNVGIGTTVPGYPLDLNSTASTFSQNIRSIYAAKIVDFQVGNANTGEGIKLDTWGALTGAAQYLKTILIISLGLAITVTSALVIRAHLTHSM